MAEFTAAVENYDRFMGRYATGLAPKFVDAAGVRAGMRVLDVGCGPGEAGSTNRGQTVWPITESSGIHPRGGASTVSRTTGSSTPTSS